MREELFENPKHRRWAAILCLILVMAAGMTLRYDDLKAWKQNPVKAMFQDKPLLTTFDGYFYLSLARDLAEDKYAELDEKRDVPAGRLRPSPPPLLSVLGALTAKVTGLSMSWVGTLLPPLLGVLLALPLYGLGCFYGGRAMGLAAALCSLLFPYYIYRSNVGWFDTDCLNATLATTAVYFSLKFGVGQGRERYLHFAGACLTYLIFLWWWDQTPDVVSVICLTPMVVALALFYRPTRDEGRKFYAVLALLVVAGLFVAGWDLPLRIIEKAQAKFAYIYTSKVEATTFPSAGLTVSEQVRPGFDEMVRKSTGSLPAFLAAGAGLLLLFVRRPKESLFLVVPLVLASFSFLFAKRFLIFLNPLTALGTGYALSWVWAQQKRSKLLIPLAPALLLFLVWPLVQDGLKRTHWPKEPGPLVAGMAEAGKLTPEDALVWAWWDHGYNMRYWADRGIISDGSNHSGEVSMYNALPLTVDSDRLAANFMTFYGARGRLGMGSLYERFEGNHQEAMVFLKAALAAGPQKAEEVISQSGPADSRTGQGLEDMLDFLYPADPKPVYLFLDQRLTVTAYWWFWFGSWDFDKRDGLHPGYDFFYNASKKGDTISGRLPKTTFSMDLRSGLLNMGQRQGQLASTLFIGKDGANTKLRYKESPISMDISSVYKVGAIMTDPMPESVFNRLFLRQHYDSRYFSLTASRFPAWQLWEVTGDRRQPSGG